jgi:hypothetical protein
MTRDEVVRLVSRALAAIQFITALLDITYLPERMLAVSRYGRVDPRLGLPFLGLLERVEISSLLFRIAGLLTLAWLFWACGPKIMELLLPGVTGEPAVPGNTGESVETAGPQQ